MNHRCMFEVGLIVAVCTIAYGVMMSALGGGWLSADNAQYAFKWGAIGYAICRVVSLIAALKTDQPYTIFFCCLGIGSFGFYLLIVRDAGI